MQIVFSEKCLHYGEDHIESPERVKKAKDILYNLGYHFLEPQSATEKDLLKVHTKEYIEKLKKGAVGDMDTPPYDNIYDYARLSAGGAVLAAQKQAFSLMRPPGHHAGREGVALGAPTQGFCYLNSIAVAVRHLGRKTLVLDIDGHHGNGTEDIFRGDKDVWFISLHGEYYPGTGRISAENCINVTLPSSCGEEAYLRALDDALAQINLKEIEVVAVSAGFDAHKGDIASLGLTTEGFAKIGERIRKINKHTFFVLEGGYSGENLGKDINSLLRYDN